jgi:hypothetical protein
LRRRRDVHRSGRPVLGTSAPRVSASAAAFVSVSHRWRGPNTDRRAAVPHARSKLVSSASTGGSGHVPVDQRRPGRHGSGTTPTARQGTSRSAIDAAETLQTTPNETTSNELRDLGADELLRIDVRGCVVAVPTSRSTAPPPTSSRPDRNSEATRWATVIRHTPERGDASRVLMRPKAVTNHRTSTVESPLILLMLFGAYACLECAYSAFDIRYMRAIAQPVWTQVSPRRAMC